MTEKFIGAFIELVPNEENEGVDFRFGWEFPDDFDQEHIDLFKNLIAGIFGLMSSQDQEIIAIGEIVRKVSNFEDAIQIVSDSEIVFTPDEELLEKFQDSKVIDINKFKPKDNK